MLALATWVPAWGDRHEASGSNRGRRSGGCYHDGRGSVRIQRYCVWQFRTVRTHHHSASSPAQSQQVSRAQCQDKAAPEASLD